MLYCLVDSGIEWTFHPKKFCSLVRSNILCNGNKKVNDKLFGTMCWSFVFSLPYHWFQYRACPKKTTRFFKIRLFFCQYQFFLIKMKGVHVRFLWENIFFHRPLLREKINFLCFEKCRNFDFFPPHKLRNFFLLKISTCGFWQFPPLFQGGGGGISSGYDFTT